MKNNFKVALLLLALSPSVYGQSPSESNELDLLEQADLELLKDSISIGEDEDISLEEEFSADVSLDSEGINTELEARSLSPLEEEDDLQSLKNDIGDSIIYEKKSELNLMKKDGMSAGKKIIKKAELKVNKGEKKIVSKGPTIFDTGAEEKKLLDLSEYVKNKIPDKEWSDINSTSKLEKYEVQKGDYLWKISQRLFGSGFYYSKIWSLNPQITNPHEIEPGMLLVFDLGSADAMPEVKVQKFDDNDLGTGVLLSKGKSANVDFSEFGDDAVSPWLRERKGLIEQGVFFQYASEETYDDLMKIGSKQLSGEYKKYNPPVADIIVKEPSDSYDSSGFDKNSKVSFEVKEGFFLNTFITTNIVEDLGKIDSKKSESVFIQKFEKIYVEFDKSVKVRPGDQYSVYSAAGRMGHEASDREGYRYTIVGQIKVIRAKNHLWECVVTDLSGLVHRGDRITVYTPKIKKITKTFNRRVVETAVIGSFKDAANTGNSFGDVVYLDRGRADGVELGNVFELYSFIDKGTGKRITPDPTYKIGEAVVITLTGNFATALITQSKSEIPYGTLGISKTEEQAARAARLKGSKLLGDIKKLEGKALEELDIELNLDDLSEDLLNKADKVKLTEDELEELERQEREKSILKDHERDLKALERLEGEIIDAENKMNESKLDEDAFLEQQDLDKVERSAKAQDPNGFESLNEIEQEVGAKYLDETLNSKDNPYGLTEYDIEEVDELLNTKEE